MRKIQNLAILFLFTSLTACQSMNSRHPSSVLSDAKDWEELRGLKQRNVELNALSLHFQKKKNEIQLAKIKDEQADIAKKIKEVESHISTLEFSQKQSIQNDGLPWREEKERLDLTQLSLYEASKNVQLPISTYEAKATEVILTQSFFSKQGITVGVGDAKPTMDFSVKCDAPFEVHNGLVNKKVSANNVYKFSLGDKKISNDQRSIHFHQDLNSCDFSFTSSMDSQNKPYGFKLYNETKKLKALNSLLSTTEVCSLKKDTDKFFNTTEFTNMTCPMKYDSIKVLPQPEDSLHARAVALLGQDLPADFIKNGDPNAALDFSKAPKFDAILVSYLVFRADFYGTLLGRLLAYHADQGTFVRVVVSEVIALDKDTAMFERLMAQHPNIKFIEYKFDTSEKNGAWFSELHRTNHVKLFAAYSKETPENSFVIVGGRNVHDGFAFRNPPEVSTFPDVVRYGKDGDESWAFWRDFEMVIHGQDFVESVVRNYMNFYHINKENLIMKLSSVAVEKEDAIDTEKKQMRHYVSIPFKDEPNLNLFYARMIDSAKKKILISSPYFRPVKEIGEAIDRAIDRGVDITIITRLDLEGDTADFILGAVNKEGVNRFLKRVKVYEYTEPKVILHSKLIMVDEEFTFVSSVNLNKRSFYHDLENGVVVNDPKFTVQMGELYKEYLESSRILTETQKVEFWKSWIIKIVDKVL
jgi:cardiolipin synthase